jgi:hypothetical protein
MIAHMHACAILAKRFSFELVVLLTADKRRMAVGMFMW